MVLNTPQKFVLKLYHEVMIILLILKILILSMIVFGYFVGRMPPVAVIPEWILRCMGATSCGLKKGFIYVSVC